MNDMNLLLAENLGDFFSALTLEVVRGLQENMRAEMILAENL